jgi:hypothetical protein
MNATATPINNVGILRLEPSGRWAIHRPGRLPLEITSGYPFRIEVQGSSELQLTRMEYRHFRHGGGEYYSVDGYELRNGFRAQFPVPGQGRWDDLR